MDVPNLPSGGPSLDGDCPDNAPPRSSLLHADPMILQGDALHLPLGDETIHCVVTSPPYWGLRDYGLGPEAIGLEPTPDLYVQHLIDIFREVRRVLRNDGTVWLNLGDCYGAGGGAQVVQTKNASHGLEGMRGAKTVAAKQLVGIPWRVTFALQMDGWRLRSDIIWAKRNPMPESVRDRPTRSHEYIFLLTKSERYYYDAPAISEPRAGQGGAAANFARSTKECPIPNQTVVQHRVNRPPTKDTGLRNKRSVWRYEGDLWTGGTQPYKLAHFATFPEKLVEPCILAGCPLGGIVLDPFVGSGTVVVVAQRLGRIGIGVDLKLAYCTLARERAYGTASDSS